jgi:hypothetical protein
MPFFFITTIKQTRKGYEHETGLKLVLFVYLVEKLPVGRDAGEILIKTQKIVIHHSDRTRAIKHRSVI